MNEEPSRTNVSHVKNLILTTFEISAKTAQAEAYELVCLKEGWGEIEANSQQWDWAYIIKKRFGETKPWRCEEERKAFYSKREEIASSYERYIQNNKRI